MVGPMSITLPQAVALLEQIAPLRFAEAWDNVGLLLQPEARDVSGVVLTIDLTESVLEEARGVGCELVVAYHPPLFEGAKRLTLASAAERVVLGAVRAGIAVYSPHTALDAAPGGMNDWLADAFGPGQRVPVVPAVDQPAVGAGRRVDLAEPAPLDEFVARIKQHLGLTHVRVARASRHERGEPVRAGAVCAGAGGSVLAPLTNVDLVLTGEMRHHDVRALVERGTSVVLCDHTNTERGYLPILAWRLEELSQNAVTTHVSTRDRDPLQVT